MSDKETHILSANTAGIEHAAAILRCGGLVAFSTETVYGLGADARNDAAVAKIYAAKERPSFNPLIVHVPDLETAQRYATFNDQALRLAETFWPAALTLVLPLRAGSGLSKLVTAGLDSVAIRVPAHATARRLLKTFDGPVAAPSANPSGRISPTTATHVVNGLGGRIDAVLDGGTCRVGLESTIIGMTGAPTLLREGGIPVDPIEQCLGIELARAGSDITAPGQLLSHYAPNGAVRLNVTDPKPDEALLGFGSVDSELNLSPSGDLVEAAANLFRLLHVLNENGASKIAVSPIPNTGLGRAINDRLIRAAAPRG